MPEIPQWDKTPTKSLYQAGEGLASLKQKNLIITLFERRKAKPPDLSKMTKKEAMVLIDRILNPT